MICDKCGDVNILYKIDPFLPNWGAKISQVDYVVVWPCQGVHGMNMAHSLKLVYLDFW